MIVLSSAETLYEKSGQTENMRTWDIIRDAFLCKQKKAPLFPDTEKRGFGKISSGFVLLCLLPCWFFLGSRYSFFTYLYHELLWSWLCLGSSFLGLCFFLW